ncbi:MAG: DinB family protein [Pirellulaceae bacterium]|nr:DinB family protein [Pirellulaceae bacterium]
MSEATQQVTFSVSSILAGYEFSRGYMMKLLEDIPEEKMATFSHGIVNHPAWQIGHLVTSGNYALEIAGHDRLVPDTWQEIFGIGSEPVEDSSKYPSKAELLEAYAAVHERVKEVLPQVDPALLTAEVTDEGIREYFGTNDLLLSFILGAHEGVHAGQLSAWRRSQGMPHVFG